MRSVVAHELRALGWRSLREEPFAGGFTSLVGVRPERVEPIPFKARRLPDEERRAARPPARPESTVRVILWQGGEVLTAARLHAAAAAPEPDAAVSQRLLTVADDAGTGFSVLEIGPAEREGELLRWDLAGLDKKDRDADRLLAMADILTKRREKSQAKRRRQKERRAASAAAAGSGSGAAEAAEAGAAPDEEALRIAEQRLGGKRKRAPEGEEVEEGAALPLDELLAAREERKRKRGRSRGSCVVS